MHPTQAFLKPNKYVSGSNVPTSIKYAVATAENLVVTITLDHALDINRVFAATAACGATFNADRFRVQIHPNNTSLTVHSKVMVCTGAKSIETSVCAANDLVLKLMYHDDDAEQPAYVRNSVIKKRPPMFWKPDIDPLTFMPIKKTSVENVVVTTRTGCTVDLSVMLKKVLPTAEYDKENFPGLVYRYGKISLTFFVSGSIIGTGSKKAKEIEDASHFAAAKVWETFQASTADNTEAQHRMLFANGVFSLNNVVRLSKQFVRETDENIYKGFMQFFVSKDHQGTFKDALIASNAAKSTEPLRQWATDIYTPFHCRRIHEIFQTTQHYEHLYNQLLGMPTFSVINAIRRHESEITSLKQKVTIFVPSDRLMERLGIASFTLEQLVRFLILERIDENAIWGRFPHGTFQMANNSTIGFQQKADSTAHWDVRLEGVGITDAQPFSSLCYEIDTMSYTDSADKETIKLFAIVDRTEWPIQCAAAAPKMANIAMFPVRPTRIVDAADVEKLTAKSQEINTMIQSFADHFIARADSPCSSSSEDSLRSTLTPSPTPSPLKKSPLKRSIDPELALRHFAKKTESPLKNK